MSDPNLEPAEPRIVKKKKISGRHHGGAWKVAYADFVTAMMALFIVLWIMSQSQAIRLAVAQYFKNPGLLPGATGVMESSDLGGEMPTPGHSQELQTPAPISPEITRDKGNLEQVKKRLQEIIAQLPEFENLKDQVLMEITQEGLRIELLERENSLFFDIGSANLKPETRKILHLIARELGRLPNRVAIEGHTDSRPYGGQGYTNWELSADRANAARRFMDGAGLRPGQVYTVRGFADRLLRNRQDPLDFQNRRVSIIVMFHHPDQEAVTTDSLLLKARETTEDAVKGAESDLKPEKGAATLPEASGPPIPALSRKAGPQGENLAGSAELLDRLKQQFKPVNPQGRLGW